MARECTAGEHYEEREIVLSGGNDRSDRRPFAMTQYADAVSVGVLAAEQKVNARAGVAGEIHCRSAMFSRGFPNSPIVVAEHEVASLR